jgi:hypothetical protein
VSVDIDLARATAIRTHGGCAHVTIAQIVDGKIPAVGDRPLRA